MNLKINRREFLKTMSLLPMVSPLTGLPGAKIKREKKRPNMLIV